MPIPIEPFYIHYPPNPKVHLVDGVEVNNAGRVLPAITTIWHGNWQGRIPPYTISGSDIHSTEGRACRRSISLSNQKQPAFVDALRAGDAYLIIDGKITDQEGNPVKEVV